jgi:hypothetical protein
MPPITLYGKKWHFASDDTPIPCFVGVLFQGSWGGLLLWGVIREDGYLRDSSCEIMELERSFLWGLTTSFLVCALINAWTAREGFQGRPLEESKRKLVPTLLTAQGFVLLVQGLLLLLWTFSIPFVEDECWEDLVSPDGLDPKSLFLFAVGLTWAVLLTYVITLLLVFDAVSKMSLMNHTRSFASYLVDPVPSCIPRWLWRKRSASERDEDATLQQLVAMEQALLRTVYDDQVPSDILLGLVLVAVRHSAMPPPQTLTGPRVDAPVLEEAMRMAKFAMAVYGVPLYLWANKRCGVCSLCCGGWCRWCFGRRRRASSSSASDMTQVQGEWMSGFPHLLHREAILQGTGVRPEDLLFVSHHNRPGGLLPYFVTKDTFHRQIVVSIRGERESRTYPSYAALRWPWISLRPSPNPNPNPNHALRYYRQISQADRSLHPG